MWNIKKRTLLNVSRNSRNRCSLGKGLVNGGWGDSSSRTCCRKNQLGWVLGYIELLFASIDDLPLVRQDWFLDPPLE